MRVTDPSGITSLRAAASTTLKALARLASSPSVNSTRLYFNVLVLRLSRWERALDKVPFTTTQIVEDLATLQRMEEKINKTVSSLIKINPEQEQSNKDLESLCKRLSKLALLRDNPNLDDAITQAMDDILKDLNELDGGDQASVSELTYELGILVGGDVARLLQPQEDRLGIITGLQAAAKNFDPRLFRQLDVHLMGKLVPEKAGHIYIGNTARDHGVQVFGDVGGESFTRFLSARLSR